MLRLDKVIKPWKDSAALNDHINLYCFWNETAFLTKSGDVGMILSVPGVDYESLDRSEQEYAVKRLEAALKAFGPGFHVYQYLFKSNRPDIPFAKYDDPIVEAAIDQRRKFFEAKRDHLYQVEIFYCILLEGARSKTGVGTALARLLRDPEGAIAELKSQFTNDSMKTLLRKHIERDLQRLDQHAQAFARQLADFMQIEILNRQGQFTFFRRLLNYDDWRVAGNPQSTQFLDYQVVNSDIEAERDHLRVGDHIVRVLTMKEAITETRPLVLDALLKIPANFYAVTEWTPLPADKARKEVNKRRRHFNLSKTGFVSQMGNDATKTNPRDVLVDESKQADIENLGDCLRALGDGQSLGDFSLTIVLYGRSRTDLDQLVAEFTGVFTNVDGNLFAETYNQLNAYFATVPGNYAMNLRKIYLLNTNYADLSFLFTILPGEKTNAHLGTECLAVVETDNSTPYFLNLHTRDVAHTLILGMTGSGKTTPVDLIEDRRKYETNAEASGAFIENVDFWREFRGAADPFVQMLNQTWYASCFIATVPRLELERYLPRTEFIVPSETYTANANPTGTARVHIGRVCAALRQIGFEVSSEHSMFRDSSSLEVLPELVTRAHDTVKMWARELLNRVDEYLAAIIGRHIQNKRARGIRVRPFTKAEFKLLLQTLEQERKRLGEGTSSRQSLNS